MKTQLIWPESDSQSHHVKMDCFWMECTDDDVKSKILPHITEKRDEFLKIVETKRIRPEIKQDYFESIYHYFFLVSKDLQYIECFDWVMPVSGQWNAWNPFLQFKPIEIQSLDELKELKYELIE